MTDPSTDSLLSVAEAIQILDAVPLSPRTVRLPLSKAQGLCLAEALKADRDYPPFNKSQMDGYAVRRADVASAKADLRVVGEIAAGRWPGRSIGPGETMAIMTGAPLPDGAEGVVPVEDVENLGDQTIRVLRSGGDPGRFVAKKGDECVAGQMVLPIGARLGPAQIAAAASIGAAQVSVFAPPRVAVLATGDELVPVERQLQPAQIRNSNTPMLVALLTRLGCDVSDLGVVPDQPDAIANALRQGLSFDALFVSGGMSMGAYDYVPKLLAELGVQFQITKLRIKPGKPFVFGVRSDPTSGASCCVFGLPGNPVSGWVCTVRLASRVLARLAGKKIEERWLGGALDVALPANGPREFYQPAVRTALAGDCASITPLAWKGSADLFTLARANVLIVRPENDPPRPAGSVVRVMEM